MEKKSPIVKDVIRSFEKLFLSLLAFDFYKEVSKTEPKAIPIMPNGN